MPSKNQSVLIKFNKFNVVLKLLEEKKKEIESKLTKTENVWMCEKMESRIWSSWKNI